MRASMSATHRLIVAGLLGLIAVPAQAGETLPNGIKLPDAWPPHTKPWTGKPMPVPYLANPPEVIPIDVGRQLFVDDFLIESTDLKRAFHRPEYHPNSPVLKPENLVEIVHRTVFLQRTAQPEIVFEPVFPAGPVAVNCDARLVGQALINIVKNAIESIEARRAEDNASPAGCIRVSVAEQDGQAAQGVHRVDAPAHRRLW